MSANGDNDLLYYHSVVLLFSENLDIKRTEATTLGGDALTQFRSAVRDILSNQNAWLLLIIVFFKALHRIG